MGVRGTTVPREAARADAVEAGQHKGACGTGSNCSRRELLTVVVVVVIVIVVIVVIVVVVVAAIVIVVVIIVVVFCTKQTCHESASGEINEC